MARPRTFDPAAILDVARDVFWTHGYAGTSYELITQATGLKKPSLYAAFGDKQHLFALILERYHQGLLAHARDILAKTGTARDVIGQWLRGFAPLCSGEHGARGCLSVNTLVEDIGRGTPIQASIDAYLRELESLLRARLDEGTAAGEYPADFATCGAAHALVAGFSGLMVLARQAPTAALTSAAIAQLLKTAEP